MKTFVDKCIDGEAFVENIDDYITEWHESNSKLPIHKYLGLTKYEYGVWITHPHTIKNIIKLHIVLRGFNPIK